jgi:hypothetical protein
MKRIFSIVLLVLGFMVASATVNAQDVEISSPIITISLDSLLNANPYAISHAYSDPWMKTKLMIQDYNTFNNVWEYQRKQTKEMVWGLGIGSLGIAGMVYAVNMPTPIRQVNNPALDDEADKAQRDRRIVGVSSMVLGAVGAILFVDSFKWTKRIKAEVGVQSLRLQYNLTGNRSYYKDKHPKRLKTGKHRWTY